MTERINTTDASGQSPEWSPTGETLLQLDAADGTVTVQVETRVDPAAPWVTVGSMRHPNLLLRIAQMPTLRLTMRGNKAGARIKVYSDE